MSLATLDDTSAKLDQLLSGPQAPPQRWLGIKTAAGYSGQSVDSIRRLISSGKLTARRPSRGRVLIDIKELDSVIASSDTKKGPWKRLMDCPGQEKEELDEF